MISKHGLLFKKLVAGAFRGNRRKPLQAGLAGCVPDRSGRTSVEGMKAVAGQVHPGLRSYAKSGARFSVNASYASWKSG